MHFILSHHLWRQKISNSFNNTLLSEDGSRLPSESGTGQNNNITRAFYGKRATKKRIIPKKQTSNTLFCLHTHKVARAWSQAATAKKRHIRPTPSDPPFYHSALHQAKLFQHHAWPFAAAFFDGVLDGRCGEVRRRILHRESRTRTYDRYYHKSQASSVESNKLRH